MSARPTPSKTFETATTQRNLQRIYREHVRKGTARGRDSTHPSALEGEIVALSARISENMRNGDYRFTQYLEQLKSKGAGRAPRVISIPTARDRITLRALADSLIRVYPEAGGVIPQVRVAELTSLLDRDHPFDSFIKLDVTNFYPSIEHDRVLQTLERRIRKVEFLDLVHQAVRTPTVASQAPRAGPNLCGVPQGLAVSNVLSELIADGVDRKFPRSSDYAYLRFVDDILILCRRVDVDHLYGVAVEAFKDKGLEVDPIEGGLGKSRSGPLATKFDYLGYCFEGSEVSVRKDRVVAIESRLAREFTRYRRSAADGRSGDALRIFANRVNLAVTGCIWDRSARGWLAYYRQLNDLSLLKRLDITVDRLRARFDTPSHIQLKTFMRAYWAIKHPKGNDARYIPNYDDLTINEMRVVLLEYMSNEEADRIHDRAVPRTFDRLISKLTIELERDVGDLS